MEGVGSSQIIPLITFLSNTGLKIKLITFEKQSLSTDLLSRFIQLGVDWSPQTFGKGGLIAGAKRMNKLRKLVPETRIIHARSDIPTFAAITSHKAPVLWDVRSLWADQKVIIQDSHLHRTLYPSYRKLESYSAQNSQGLSTLTQAIVPILEARNKVIPSVREVIPTAVDLKRFNPKMSMPSRIRALFSGTYNDYYDLESSKVFLDSFRARLSLEVHWARPYESMRKTLGVGEESVFTCSQNEMANVIPDYSFGVAICKKLGGQSLAAAMPTKIAEFLACGRPVIVNQGLGDMDELIKKFNVGVVIGNTQDAILDNVEQLIQLISDSDTPHRCRELAESHFNMELSGKKYLQIYEKIASRPFL